jgi:hypothetical protein
MTYQELKEMIIYIIKKETFFSRGHAEQMADDILEQMKEYMKGGKKE